MNNFPEHIIDLMYEYVPEERAKVLQATQRQIKAKARALANEYNKLMRLSKKYDRKRNSFCIRS